MTRPTRAELEAIVHDLQSRLQLEREAAAAYAHDRSEQYTDKSSAKVALEDLAAALLEGEHIVAAEHGELDDMIAHHCRFAAKRKSASPDRVPNEGAVRMLIPGMVCRACLNARHGGCEKACTHGIDLATGKPIPGTCTECGALVERLHCPDGPKPAGQSGGMGS